MRAVIGDGRSQYPLLFVGGKGGGLGSCGRLDCFHATRSNHVETLLSSPLLLLSLIGCQEPVGEACSTPQLEDGSCGDENQIHHPDGGRIRLVGDTANPGNVRLLFTGCDGIVVDEGSTLGFVGGF